MNAAATRLYDVTRKRGLSMKDLARETGLGLRSIHNLSCGNSKSRRARQAITNTLRTDIWPGIKVTERLLWLMPQTSFEFQSVQLAVETEQQLAGFTERQGRVVVVTKPVLLRVDASTASDRGLDTDQEKPVLENAPEVANVS